MNSLQITYATAAIAATINFGPNNSTKKVCYSILSIIYGSSLAHRFVIIRKKKENIFLLNLANYMSTRIAPLKNNFCSTSNIYDTLKRYLETTTSRFLSIEQQLHSKQKQSTNINQQMIYEKCEIAIQRVLELINEESYHIHEYEDTTKRRKRIKYLKEEFEKAHFTLST